jgi:FtsP/CotA-like multicopper oxidase with cupredoxin domain
MNYSAMNKLARTWGSFATWVGVALGVGVAASAGAANPVSGIPVLDATSTRLGVQAVYKTMHDGKRLAFWVYCPDGMGGGGGMGGGMGGGGMGGGGCPLSGPTLQVGVGQTTRVVLDMMMMVPEEAAPYQGHTIHFHGLDVPQSEDGVPETDAPVLGDTYTFSIDSRYVGSHMYHCHVHTVKHMEMGMYGAFVVKDVGSGGALLNVINHGGPSYDYEWNLVLSTVDPAYHADTAVGDSKVFADYNPKYFLVNGNEGLTMTAPADSLAAAPGKKVAIRLIGIHAVNTRFQITDAGGAVKSFTVHNVDGFALPSAKSQTSIDVPPGSTADIMVTLPNTGGTWYPRVTYLNTRNGGTYANGTVYTKLVF